MADVFRVGLDRGFLNEQGEIAWGDIGIAAMDADPGVEHEFIAERVAEVTPAIVARCNGLILGGTAVTARSFTEGAADLVVVARHGVGYDRIDVDACTRNDVALCTTPAASRHPVASASFAYMIALAKRMADKDRLVRYGRWQLSGAYCGSEIYGKTLGIVGFGNTGGELARLVAPWEVRVLVFDPYLDPDAARLRGVEPAPLDTVLSQADFVCIHAKLTDETRGLIGARELGLMKRSAYLINVARGPIVDQEALIAALAQRRIAGAGLDVFEEEPLPITSRLIGFDNVMLSPHTMAHTRDLSIAMGEINSEQMIAASRGEPPGSVVNLEVLERPGFRAKLGRWRAGSA